MNNLVNVKYNKVTKVQEFRYPNFVEIGHAYVEVDGYYGFVFKEGSAGFWDANVLRMIAERLDELNEEWDKKVTKDLRDQFNRNKS